MHLIHLYGIVVIAAIVHILNTHTLFFSYTMFCLPILRICVHSLRDIVSLLLKTLFSVDDHAISIFSVGSRRWTRT